MSVKTYQAYAMAEALAAAKRDLGPDAVIIETRTFKRGGVLGVGRRTIFELTATSSDRAELSPKARPDGRRAARAYAYAGGRAAVEPRPAADAASTGPSDFERTRRLAQALVEAHDRRRSDAPAPVPPPQDPEATRPAARTARPRPAEAPVARRFILTPPDRPGPPAEAAPRPAAAELDPLGPAGSAVLTQASAMPVHEELCAIRSMVGRMLQRQTVPAAPMPGMPDKLFEMYLELIGQDVSRELAERIVAEARQNLDDDLVDDVDAIRESVLDRVAALLPAADPAIPRRSPDDRPLTIALVGPTGVGKTTTLAKLAASFKLRDRRRVGLVTCDTYRIAAVDQLRTYANIIGLPLEVALTPSDMRRAVHTLRDCDVVLIDSAGRGPRDRGRLGELRQCLEAAAPHETHLVLASTASERVLLREAEAFADVGADRVVLTKLDEAVSFGVVVNVLQTVGKSLSWITTGQEVPDHIEAGHSRRLAELVLGAELHA